MTTTWFVLTRTVHFGACLLFFGVFAFDRFVAVSIAPASEAETAAYGNRCLRWFGWILPPTILLSGIIWFILVTSRMSDLPFELAITPANLDMIRTQTHFGAVWQVRFLFWAAAVLAQALATIFKSRVSFWKFLVWLQLFCAGLMLGSLAWAGHGQEGQPVRWHLAADAVHLVATGFWPTGLLPLLVLLHELSRGTDSGQIRAVAVLVRRFSAMSLAAVAILSLTGLVNTWFLVGSFSNLLHDIYGRWLLVKISLFILMVLIGGANLLRLKPRLSAEPDQAAAVVTTVNQLKRNVRWELLLGTAILIIVAILGILPPAMH